ncbi:MAG: CDP-alcohol phosphatidyltransferase family protein [Deltaproteobacteria bacterium]|nr:CDP-alcohol phosphatidyltransferase family protein [Deltaproteobacteria bacterium]
MSQLGFPLNLMRLSPSEQDCSQKILENTEAWIARNVNKRVSLPISILLARANIAPNHITFFNLLLGIAAGVIAAFGGYPSLLAAGFLFQAVSIIDGCDGEVAKLNQKATRFGAWFDTVGDNLSFVAFITGVTFGLYHETHAVWILHLAKVSLLSFAVLLSIMINYLIQQKGSSASLVTYEKEVVTSQAKKQNPLVAKALHYGKFLVKKDFFAFLFFFLALVNLPQAIVFFSALGTSAVAVILSVITLKNRRSAKAMEAKVVNEEATGVSS